MRRGYRLAIKQRFGYLSAAVIIYLLDQLTKALATHYLPGAGYHQGVSVIDGFFHLTYVENAGIAWGLFADVGTGGRLALGAISFIAAMGIILYAVRTPVSERMTHWGLTLVLGGVLGNLTDRLVRGVVIDFLDFTIGSYRWPTFNIADMAISVGAAILILDALRSPKTERQAHPVEGLPSE